MENHKIKNSIYTGNEGAVSISGGNNMKNPLYNAFIDAAIEAGYRKLRTITDINKRDLGKNI